MKQIILAASFLSANVLYAQNAFRSAPTDNRSPFTIDCPAYFSKHDIVYKSPSYEGFEGFPLGNGDLGGMLWCTQSGIRIQVNKSDIFDAGNAEVKNNLRSCGQLDIDLGSPSMDWIQLKDFDARLSLYEAKASINAVTPFAKTTIESIVSADKNVWLITCKRSDVIDIVGPTAVKVGLERWGSRAFRGWYSGYSKKPEDGMGNAKAGKDGNIIYIQEQFSNMQFAMACMVVGKPTTVEAISNKRMELSSEAFDNGEIHILVSVATSNETKDPLAQAKKLLADASAETIEKINRQHADWWRQFWQRSFVHIPDDYLENLYYLRRYILGSSSRGLYPALFNGAIFTWNHDVRNWVTPHHWNEQQIYWGILPQGDTDLLETYMNAYFRIMPEAKKYAETRGAKNALLWTEPHDYDGTMVGAHWENMVNNFTPASQIAMFFWDYYAYTKDNDFLKNKAYPFMKGAAEFYLQKLQWDSAAKRYFLFPVQPYEHAEDSQLKNTVTDLAMIKALFAKCIVSAQLLGMDKDKQKQWEHMLQYLWEPPMGNDEKGKEEFMLAYAPDGKIYPDTSLRKGVYMGHFAANTLFVFPAELIGIDDKGSRYFNAVVNAINDVSAFKNAINPNPIVAARLGMGNESYTMLQNRIRELQHFPQGLFYNIDHWFQYSKYADSLKFPQFSAQRDYVYDARARYESGLPNHPFVQCGLEPMGPLGAAVNEMLLQSNEGKIRLFPAVPTEWQWQTLAFTLWAQNGFRISVLRDSLGNIQPVSVFSSAGGDCHIMNPWGNKKFKIISSAGKNISGKMIKDNVIQFTTQKGLTYTLIPDQIKGGSVEFTGTKNNNAKKYREAILGKERDF